MQVILDIFMNKNPFVSMEGYELYYIGYNTSLCLKLFTTFIQFYNLGFMCTYLHVKVHVAPNA